MKLPKLIARRESICLECEHKKVTDKVPRCGVCGCRIAARIWVSCPKRKW